MAHEVAQWLAEIKTLKQQVAELERDRDVALESAANWRQLYTTEAQQRRTEAKLAQQQIEKLASQLRQLQSSPQSTEDNPGAVEAVRAEVEQLENLEDLKAKLTEAMVERDRLTQALKSEQTNHAQTRRSLTTAIGDTLDRLSRERITRQPAANSGQSVPRGQWVGVTTQASKNNKQTPPSSQEEEGHNPRRKA
ncbi:hypothetical protein [Coleofasciculus sp. FACHB-1120]|uniref:hypothetical protein n=1 Tax=Coleofasciculus sp. FACHB-1120 TaxID=2692783 RepID=UPI001A7EFE7C|nr:hypothetical protein [Coleofasciculus sp. FACHB-1120]